MSEETTEKLEETTPKVTEKIKKVFKKKNEDKQRPEVKKNHIKRFLVKYKGLDAYEGNPEEYLFNNVKKPVINWIISILLTAIVVYLAAVSLLYFYTIPIGIAIIWWLIIEFIKDCKRCK